MAGREMKLVYIAGKYRAEHPYEKWTNIMSAWTHGAKVAAMGHFPVVPHLTTMLMDGIQDDDYFLRGTIELLRRCDAIYLMPGWEESEGARGEKLKAEEWGMEIIKDELGATL